MNLLGVIFPFFLVFLRIEGLNVKLNCSSCDNESKAVCDLNTIECQVGNLCYALKFEENKEIKFRRGCRPREFCKNTLDFCDRLDVTQKCLGTGCCSTNLCDPSLTAPPMPSPTIYTSPARPQTTVKDLMTPEISPFIAKPTTFESLTAVPTRSTRSTWMDVMTPGISSSSKKLTKFESLVLIPTGSTRPTCRNTAGMRLVLSPPTIVFAVMLLLALVF